LYALRWTRVCSSFETGRDENRPEPRGARRSSQPFRERLSTTSNLPAYFAAFYAARAALEAAGEPSPKTHSGMRSRFSDLARSTPSIGAEVGRALSQLGTNRAEVDYDEPAITIDEAKDAIAKARRVVEVVEQAIATGLGPSPPP
jgi:uncharacterized protein (UPF0332 family)